MIEVSINDKKTRFPTKPTMDVNITGACSSGGVMVVSLTQTSETDFSADKTFAEISAAIEAGQSVVLKVITGTISSFVPLHMYTSNIVAFQGIQFQPSDFSNPSVMDGMMVGMYQCDANNIWQTGGEIYQLTIPK